MLILIQITLNILQICMTCLQSGGQTKIIRSEPQDFGLGTDNAVSPNALGCLTLRYAALLNFATSIPDKWDFRSMKRAYHKRRNAEFIVLGKVFRG